MIRTEGSGGGHVLAMLENFIPSLRLSRDSLEELATRVRRAKYHPTEEELRIFSRYYAGMRAVLV